MTTPPAAPAATTTNRCLPMISSRIVETLDPCVVLLKQWIEQYSPTFCYPHHDDDDHDDDGSLNVNRYKNIILSLAQGVVYWKPPPDTMNRALSLMSASQDSLTLQLHCYGPAIGLPEFVDLLQHKIRTENSLTNHKIMVTAGANQAYMNCMLCLLDDNNNNDNNNDNDNDNNYKASNKAVVFCPYYFNHVMAIQMVAGQNAVLVGPSKNDGIPDVDWLEKQLSGNNHNNNNNIRVVTVVNPGNPTGVTIPNLVMQRIVDVTRQYNVWLIIDCTYEYFTTDRSNHQPIFTATSASASASASAGTTTTISDNSNNSNNNNFDNKNNSHVLHIFSFSKSYSLAGYRCGYVVVHEDAKGTTTSTSSSSNDDDVSLSYSLWDQMLKVQDTILISPSRITQYVAMAAMTTTSDDSSNSSSSGSGGGQDGGGVGGGKEWVYRQYDTLQQSRELILDALKSNNLQTIGGNGSMYVMAKLPSMNRSTISVSVSKSTSSQQQQQQPDTHGSDKNDDDDDDNNNNDNDEFVKSTTSTTHEDDDNKRKNKVKTDSNESEIESEIEEVTMDDVEICRLLVQRYGIAIIPGTFCGLPGWVRVCYANLHPNQTKIAAKRLKHGLRQLIAEETETKKRDRNDKQQQMTNNK